MKKITCVGEWKLKEWVFKFGSFPISQETHLDLGEAYTHREAHVFGLENGKAALVIEEGCSCYSASDANIEVFSSKKKAIEAFDKWVKEKRRMGYR